MEQYRGAYNQGLLTDPMDMASFNPYAPLAAGLMFAPGSGVADVAGYAPSMTTAGEYEPSMMANIGSGRYMDAGLQGLGLLGDAFMAAGTVVPPLIPVGAAMKVPRAGRVANATIGHNRPPAVVGKTPAIVPNELRGTEFKTAVLPDGSRTLIDAGGNPYIEEKTLNKLLTGVPHDRMTSEFTPPPAGTLLPEVEVKPEDFEGSWMVNLSGDRTRFGNLSKVNDIELYGGGVDLEGGNDYMRSLRAVWASAPGAVSGIENQIKAIRKGAGRRRPKCTNLRHINKDGIAISCFCC